MYEFLLFSRRGSTDGDFESLRDGGRLDVVHQCLLMAFFRSHALRRDIVFHVILGGPPCPPLHMKVDGRELRDTGTDERTWEAVLRAVLKGESHPGISLERESLQDVIKRKSGVGYSIFVLEEKGKDASEAKFNEPALFVLGDQVGLPRKEEKFVLRYAEKISLGKQRYLSASCIDILNFILDRQDACMDR